MPLITSVNKRPHEPNSYKVEYEGAFGDHGFISVFAKDELQAFATATKELEERSMTARVTIIGATVVLLAVLAASTYGCDKSSRDMEACLKVGKNYVSENQGYSCK